MLFSAQNVVLRQNKKSVYHKTMRMIQKNAEKIVCSESKKTQDICLLSDFAKSSKIADQLFCVFLLSQRKLYFFCNSQKQQRFQQLQKRDLIGFFKYKKITCN